jgi:hypothetical protein
MERSRGSGIGTDDSHASRGKGVCIDGKLAKNPSFGGEREGARRTDRERDRDDDLRSLGLRRRGRLQSGHHEDRHAIWLWARAAWRFRADV